jgi:hypothetical protein
MGVSVRADHSMEYPMRASSIVAFTLFVAACGGSNNGNNNNNQDIDAPGSGSGSGSNTPHDAALDGPNLPSGVYAIPLTTPDDSFWAPALTINGVQYVMDLDTGSTSTGVAASTCTDCGVTPLYAPGAGATDEHQTASTEYEDGTGWMGEIYQDTISLENGSPNGTLNIVGISTQVVGNMGMAGFFDGANDYQGILGMGAPENAEPNTGAYFTTLTQGGMTAAMAFELCGDGGTMWLGGFDPTHTSAAPGYTPMDAISADQAFYSIDLTGLAVGATAITDSTAAEFTDWVVDTGTTFFYVPTKMETAMIKAINADPSFKTLFPATTLKDDPNGSGIGCTKTSTVTDAQVESMLPKFTMTMKNKAGGADITVSAGPLESYLYDMGGGQFCLGIGDGGTGAGAATMGDQIMQSFVTIIDVQNQQIGWAPDSGCGPAVRRSRDRRTFHPHLPKPHHPHHN